MKKNILIYSLLFVSTITFAQKNNIQTTWDALKHNELDKAKRAIDLAAEHPDTKAAPKMWLYRGKTYLAISDAKDKFKDLDADATEKAYTSFVNCLKADKDKIYTDEATSLLVPSALKLYYKAMSNADNKEYERSIRYLNLLPDAFQFDKDKSLQRSNITPESINRDLYSIARMSGDKVNAKEYLQKLIDIKYKDPLIYLDMSRLMLEDKDTTKALSYIEMGRNLFDENPKLINAELSIYSSQGKIDALLEKTNKAIESAPDNEMFYYIQGIIYRDKKQMDKAETAYKKAVELNPTYFDANFELGALYFNQGVDLNNKANDLPVSKAKEYDLMNAKATEEFKKAITYFEKANEINATDNSVVQSLLKLYKTTGETEKYNKLKEKQPVKK